MLASINKPHPLLTMILPRIILQYNDVITLGLHEVTPQSHTNHLISTKIGAWLFQIYPYHSTTHMPQGAWPKVASIHVDPNLLLSIRGLFS